MNLHLAIELARRAHAGQTDLQGRAYVDAHLRPIAEACAVFGPDAETGGWLHDILEDTPTTAQDLLDNGVPDALVRAVQSVTRWAGETYTELIGRSAADPLGCLVKIVDNAWNITCNPDLAATDPDKARRLLDEKYLPARERLLAAAGLGLETEPVLRMQRELDRHRTRLSGE